jgi:hypothetical protein
MANSLGAAAHALDSDVTTLVTDLATFLAARGTARDFVYWLELKLMNTVGYGPAMTSAIVKGRKGRPSPAAVNKTLVALSGGVYP